MKTKRLFALMLAALMTLSLLTACSKDEPQDADDNNAGTHQPADDKQEDKKDEDPADDDKKDENAGDARTITVGTVGTGEPYTLIHDDGSWTGVEPELWDEVEKRLGWTIEVKQVGDMASLFGELDTGRVDVAANCFAITEARLEKYIVSDPLYADAQVIIVQPDSEYQTFEDLRGCTIGVTAGQAAQTTVEAMAPEYDWEVITYEDSSAGFQDCSLGRIDSYANTITNIEKAERAQGLEFRQLDEKLFGNNVGWWFADTEEGAEIRDELNKVIKELHDDGTLSKICEKWFFEDLTQIISTDWLTATR